MLSVDVERVPGPGKQHGKHLRTLKDAAFQINIMPLIEKLLRNFAGGLARVQRCNNLMHPAAHAVLGGAKDHILVSTPASAATHLQ